MNVVVIVGVAVVGALLWIRRDMRHDIAELRHDIADLRRDIADLRRDLSAQMAAIPARGAEIVLTTPQSPRR